METQEWLQLKYINKILILRQTVRVVYVLRDCIRREETLKMGTTELEVLEKNPQSKPNENSGKEK